MSERTFKEALCEMNGIDESRYLSFALKKTLFLRVRLLHPFISVFYPDHLFNEKRLLERVSRAVDLREVQDEVDFYHHKYVVNFVLKDAFRFRLSGYRLLMLAGKVFKNSSTD